MEVVDGQWQTRTRRHWRCHGEGLPFASRCPSAEGAFFSGKHFYLIKTLTNPRTTGPPKEAHRSTGGASSRSWHHISLQPCQWGV